MLKAGVPGEPPAPIFVEADSTSVTIDVQPSVDANGSPITLYEIWHDIGENVQEIDQKVTDYDGESPRHTITGLTPGLFYKFAVIAINAEGPSTMSTYVTVATSSLPAQP